MSDIPLRQRSSTEIVDAAFQIFRREPLQFIAASALIYVPWLVLQLLIGVNIDPGIRPTTNQIIVSLIGSLVVYTFAGGVTSILASDVYLDRPTDLGRAFRTVAARAVPLAGAVIISSFFIGIGLMLLFVPGFYALARFFAVKQGVVLENRSTIEALSRSSHLSVDTKRHILGTLILVGLLIAAVSFGAQIGVTMIPTRIAQITLLHAISAILYPFFGITETVLYYDMRIRKEGFDVEHLASLGPAGGVAPAPATSV
ncbi:MAG TPA: hypothetical protein VK636_19375 [Gemmatimonadaceae bacterium]|nr:hypothetical protein [Gemmatimonadaceae bacterium]